MFSNSRRWLVAVAVATAAVGLSACGDGGAEQTPAAASGTAPPTTTTAAVTGAPSASSSDVVSTGTPVETEPPTSVATDPPVTQASGAADVQISYAAWDGASTSVEVAGYVAGRVEDGGTCTLTLRSGSVTRTATGPGIADAKTTVCGLLTVAGGDLTSGSWQATLAYRSSASEGTSAPTEVQVP